MAFRKTKRRTGTITVAATDSRRRERAKSVWIKEQTRVQRYRPTRKIIHTMARMRLSLFLCFIKIPCLSWINAFVNLAAASVQYGSAIGASKTVTCFLNIISGIGIMSIESSGEARATPCANRL